MLIPLTTQTSTGTCHASIQLLLRSSHITFISFTGRTTSRTWLRPTRSEMPSRPSSQIPWVPTATTCSTMISAACWTLMFSQLGPSQWHSGLSSSFLVTYSPCKSGPSRTADTSASSFTRTVDARLKIIQTGHSGLVRLSPWI